MVGMATVYTAKDNVLNRFVAVKILRDEFTTDSDFIKRFNSEAQSAASLTHPYIVSIFDVGNEGNLYYIVMELIQGKTLKDNNKLNNKLQKKVEQVVFEKQKEVEQSQVQENEVKFRESLKSLKRKKFEDFRTFPIEFECITIKLLMISLKGGI